MAYHENSEKPTWQETPAKTVGSPSLAMIARFHANQPMKKVYNSELENRRNKSDLYFKARM